MVHRRWGGFVAIIAYQSRDLTHQSEIRAVHALLHIYLLAPIASGLKHEPVFCHHIPVNPIKPLDPGRQGDQLVLIFHSSTSSQVNDFRAAWAILCIVSPSRRPPSERFSQYSRQRSAAL